MCSYLQKRKNLILLYALVTGIYFGVFILYGIPLDAPIYACILASTLLLAYGIFDFIKYRNKCCQLEQISQQQFLEPMHFPQAEDQMEELYQEALSRIAEEKRNMESAICISRQEMKDYYGMWVHQIKTPIAALHVLLQSEEPSVREMNQEVFKIEQYVEMVLTYLRMEEMGHDLCFERCSLDAIVKQAVRKYSQMFILKRIRLEYEPLDVTVLTDEKWLTFVVEQLLSNALKYTKEGFIRITFAKGSLVIEDTGIGIWAEDLPRVFERGFTGYNGRCDKKSTGIGLYLCKCILDQLKHPIQIESEIDQGTKVFVHLERDVLHVE